MNGELAPNYEKPILQLKGLDKNFPGVHAVDHVDLTLYEHEILGISGENGAGKSTLLKMISGVYQPDDGEILFLGKKAEFRDPAASIRAGISIIHQELSNLDNLTVAENVYLGRLPYRWGLAVDWKKLNRNVQDLMSKYELNISPTAKMKDLSMAEKQLVEIIKALSANVRIIIMDEPTSSLGIDNVEKLMKIVRRVHAKGIAFIFISHRLEELFEICHRIVVLRDGKNVAQFSHEQFDISALVAKMVGRDMNEFYSKQKIEKGEAVLTLSSVTSAKLKEVSLKVRRGEIVGLYGMAGAGQDDIMETIFGLQKDWSGQIQLFGEDYHGNAPHEAIRRGICYISEDRRGTGLSLVHSICDNIAMANYGKFSRGGVVRWKELKQSARHWMAELEIKAPSIYTKTETLSGGNQQKVILGKWIENDPQLLLLNEPTRGIDVKTKHDLFQIVQNLCKKGMAVLMISSDMMEMLSMADTIYTVCDGRITACFAREEATQQKLLRAAIDVKEKEA